MEIENIKKIQKLYRKNINQINLINKELNRTYNHISGIMVRINNNFLKEIKNQYDYNYEMELLDNQLLLFKNIPRPFKLRDKLYFNTNNIIEKIKIINDNLFIIMKKSGCLNIFDSFELISNEGINDILGNFSKKDKNSLYFYNKVFIPLEIIKYNFTDVNINNNELILYKSNNLNNKTNDMININNTDKIIF